MGKIQFLKYTLKKSHIPIQEYDYKCDFFLIKKKYFSLYKKNI